MKSLLSVGFLSFLIVPAAGFAEPVSRTATIDTPRFEGTRVTTRDREAGSFARDVDLVRRSDGATASRDIDRRHTESGMTNSASTTRFNGDTRISNTVRTRTTNGYRDEGSVTGFNGETYAYGGGGRRTPNGFVRGHGLRDGDGDLVAARRVAVRRTPNGGTVRRATGYRAPPRGR